MCTQHNTLWIIEDRYKNFDDLMLRSQYTMKSKIGNGNMILLLSMWVVCQYGQFGEELRYMTIPLRRPLRKSFHLYNYFILDLSLLIEIPLYILYCQAQSHLLLCWTELALFSLLYLQLPPGIVSWRLWTQMDAV